MAPNRLKSILARQKKIRTGQLPLVISRYNIKIMGRVIVINPNMQAHESDWRTSMESFPVVHHPENSRFEVIVENRTARLDYTLEGDMIFFTHTYVPSALERRGIGGALAQAGMDYAREMGYKVVPICSFIRHYVETHPGTADLIDPGHSMV